MKESLRRIIENLRRCGAEVEEWELASGRLRWDISFRSQQWSVWDSGEVYSARDPHNDSYDVLNLVDDFVDELIIDAGTRGA